MEVLGAAVDVRGEAGEETAARQVCAGRPGELFVAIASRDPTAAQVRIRGSA